MKWLRILLVPAVIAAVAIGCLRDSEATDEDSAARESEDRGQESQTRTYAVNKTDEEWRQELTPEAYRVLRRAGTEPAFNNAYWDNKQEGTYVCAGCGQELFSSDAKFASGTGWPSYTQPIESDRVVEKVDRTAGMIRTEILCSRCGGHLGHVFNDGPAPTGLRYCMNSTALDFHPADDSDASAE